MRLILTWLPTGTHSAGNLTFAAPTTDNTGVSPAAFPLYVVSAYDTELKATLIRTNGFAGMVDVTYTVTNTTFTDLFITNITGTNTLITNSYRHIHQHLGHQLCGGQLHPKFPAAIYLTTVSTQMDSAFLATNR